jgi:hypothetical protein
MTLVSSDDLDWEFASLHHDKDYLSEFFRRITRKLGNPKQSPPQLTNSHALCITCSAPKRLTTKLSFIAATKKL